MNGSDGKVAAPSEPSLTTHYSLPTWQLPPGVSRGLWDYVHDAGAARAYDAQLAGTSLLAYDQEFALRHFPTPGRAVDLGCGTGRLAMRLAECGHRVLALDLAAEMLRIVGEKAAQAGVPVDRLRANLVELDCLADGSFDYAACLFGTLGLVAGAEARCQFLRHVRRILRPGGVFVVHVHNRHFHLGTRAGRRLLVKNWWDAVLGRGVGGDFMMPPHQGLGSMVMHLFTRREITRLLCGVGLEVTEMRPLSLHSDGVLPAPWWFGGWRAYGYLIAARAIEGPA